MKGTLNISLDDGKLFTKNVYEGTLFYLQFKALAMLYKHNINKAEVKSIWFTPERIQININAIT